MNRFSKILAVGAASMLSGAVANAGLIDFTLADNGQNTVALTSAYQPIVGTTISYNNVSTYNASADHTSGTAGTDNYFVYPTTGNAGIVELDFSNGVLIPSFYYDNFHATGGVVATAYSGATLLTSVDLTVPAHADSAPTFALSTAFSSFSGITKITFQNDNGAADAVNIDDITANVPEPASLGLLGVGGLSLLARRRRQA